MVITIIVTVEGKEIQTQEKGGEGIILMMITIITVVEGKEIEMLKEESIINNYNNDKQNQTEATPLAQ